MSEWLARQDESVSLLAELLRIDTTDANETAVAERLRDYFAGHGIESELVGEFPDRLNIVARLRGSRPGPTLCLLAHMDVVPAGAAEWSVPPFSGAVREGWIWGRGATDMKNQLVAHAVAFAHLAVERADLAGDLLFVATCDEENGDVCGAQWLVNERPGLVRCDYLLTEGGGEFTVIGERRLYPITTGEKTVAQFRLRIEGLGGTAQRPFMTRTPWRPLRGLSRCSPITMRQLR